MYVIAVVAVVGDDGISRVDGGDGIRRRGDAAVSQRPSSPVNVLGRSPSSVHVRRRTSAYGDGRESRRLTSTHIESSTDVGERRWTPACMDGYRCTSAWTPFHVHQRWKISIFLGRR